MRNRSYPLPAIIAASVAFTLLVAADSQHAGQDRADLRAAFIGNIYGQLPTTSYGGWLAGERNGHQYVIQHVANYGMEMLWLQVRIDQEQLDRPLWRVVDVLVLPTPSERNGLEFCSGGSRDTCIGALYEKSGEKGERIYRSAWRANLETERIEVMPAEEADCGPPGDD